MPGPIYTAQELHNLQTQNRQIMPTNSSVNKVLSTPQPKARFTGCSACQMAAMARMNQEQRLAYMQSHNLISQQAEIEKKLESAKKGKLGPQIKE